MSSREQPGLIDLPDELLECVMVYLSLEDLLSLGIIGNKRLGDCASMFVQRDLFGKRVFNGFYCLQLIDKTHGPHYIIIS